MSENSVINISHFLLKRKSLYSIYNYFNIGDKMKKSKKFNLPVSPKVILVGIIGLALFLAYFDLISWWKAIQALVTVVLFGFIAAIFLDDTQDVMSKLLSIAGFVMGGILVFIPDPITTILGLGIMGFTAYKMGWIGKNHTIL